MRLFVIWKSKYNFPHIFGCKRENAVIYLNKMPTLISLCWRPTINQRRVEGNVICRRIYCTTAACSFCTFVFVYFSSFVFVYFCSFVWLFNFFCLFVFFVYFCIIMWLYSDFPLYLFICVFLAPFCLLPFCLFCVCEVCILYCNVISLRIYCTNAACLGERRASTSWTGFTNRTKQKQSKVPKFNLLCMSQNIKIRCFCHKILIYASWANFFLVFLSLERTQYFMDAWRGDV